MKPFRQPVPPVFIALGGLLLAYILLPLLGLLPRLSAGTLRDWGQPAVLDAVRVSVVTATAAILLLTVLGVPLAYLLARQNFRGKALVNLVIQLPLAVPPVVAGIMLLSAFGPYTAIGAWFAGRGLPLTDSLVAIGIAQAFVASPFLVVAARAAFAAVEPALEEVAATLGKSPWRTFRRITLPLAWPAICSGIALAWVRALGEFGAAAIVAYHPHTLSVLTWVRFSSSGLASTLPLVALLLAVGALGLALSLLLVRHRPARGGPRLPVPTDPREAADPPAQVGRCPADQPAATPVAVEISHRLGDFRLDLRFRTQHRRIAVLGPSGSGKTLLLRALAGLLRPEAGELSVGGRALFAAGRVWLPPAQRRAGYVPQQLALFPHLTVWQNLGFAMPEGTPDQRPAAEALHLLGLAELAHAYPDQLSYGQQQRVALARALVRRPDYLLLDEPFAALDTPLRIQLRRELLRILRRLDLPVVLVTHDPQEAQELAEEIVVMAAGRLLQCGPVAEVFQAPASVQVAHLLGMRNLFSGTVAAATGGATGIAYQSGTLLAPPGGGAPGAAVAFFVSPHRLTVLGAAEPAPAPSGTLLDGIVDAVWRLPGSVRLLVIIGAGSRREYWEVAGTQPPGTSSDWAEGDAVRLFVPQDAVRLLPTAGPEGEGRQ